MTISYSYQRNNEIQIKVLYEDLCFFWAISTKLTVYAFLTHCYILWNFGQDRMTILLYNLHRNNQMSINVRCQAWFFLSYLNQIHRFLLQSNTIFILQNSKSNCNKLQNSVQRKCKFFIYIYKTLCPHKFTNWLADETSRCRLNGSRYRYNLLKLRLSNLIFSIWHCYSLLLI